MKRLVVLVVLAFAPALLAQPLSIVDVAAPDINCVFNPACKVTVQDMTSAIFTNGFLQSRNYRGAPGAPAHGLYAFEYRVDLTQVVGITFIPCVNALTVNIGPNVKLDFNHDGVKDDVFVVTKGGLGNVSLASAVRSGNNVTFTFKTPVCGGASAGKGDTSFFFGYVSKYPRRNVIAKAPNNAGAPLSLKAWAPNHP